MSSQLFYSIVYKEETFGEKQIVFFFKRFSENIYNRKKKLDSQT